MSRFRFRLDRLLGVRRVEETVARADWLVAERNALGAEATAAAALTAVEGARASLAQMQSRASMVPADVLVVQGSVDRLREQWVQKTIQASRARREAERLRLLLTERRVSVRGLETLRTHAREDWRLETEAQANRELDERANPRRTSITEALEQRAARELSEKS